jgi:hypothetical protein
MINNNMLYGIADLCVGNAVTIPSYLAIGSTGGTLTSNDIITSGEFQRIPVTKTRSGTVIQWAATALASSATSNLINVIGLMNSSSGGNLWANTLMPSLLQTSNYDIDFEIWVNLVGV